MSEPFEWRIRQRSHARPAVQRGGSGGELLYWFNALQKYLNMISHKTLSCVLKELEKDDLIIRKEYHQIPPKVEYSLSEKGKSFIPILYALCEWGEEYMGK